jgi:hypothetical protein
MVADEMHAATMKAKYDSSSAELNANPEVGLIMAEAVGAWGDTEADLADMQRLGKRHEFKAWPRTASLSTSTTC